MLNNYSAYLNDWKNRVKRHYSQISENYLHYEKINAYFYAYRRKILQKLIPPNLRILDLASGGGDNLRALNPREATAVDFCPEMIALVRKRFPEWQAFAMDADGFKTRKPFDCILAVNLLLESPDVFKTLQNIRSLLEEGASLVVLNHGSAWEWLFRLHTSWIHGKTRLPQNWLNRRDCENLFSNTGFKILKKRKEMILPFRIPWVSDALNFLFSVVPWLNHFCLLEIYVLKPHSEKSLPPMSCTVVVPCKNEAENVPLILPRIPQMGSFTEVVFVDDASTDKTREAMQEAQKKHPEFRVQIVKGPGLGKGAACREGFRNASGDVFLILDADMTVAPEVLPDFFEILQNGRAEFVNGSRQVYRLEKDSMRFLNRIGNSFFAFLFSWLLGCRVNDTLCGTKACLKRDYSKILETRKILGEKDVWGDFDWIFTVLRHSLDYTEHPVHYFPRTYGDTKMTKRLHNARIMFRHWATAFRKLR